MGVVMTTAAPHAAEAGLEHLQRKPVSDVKREGWRGVMKGVGAAGKLLMTNHDQPEAVILSLQEFRRLTELAESALRDRERKLEGLSQAFDAELAVLRQADAGSRLRQAFGAPLALNGKANGKANGKVNGKVIAGPSY
jgi:PHD/YefM family antitoxin component YafN of YafNO toxin-antitoxin module